MFFAVPRNRVKIFQTRWVVAIPRGWSTWQEPELPNGKLWQGDPSSSQGELLLVLSALVLTTTQVGHLCETFVPQVGHVHLGDRGAGRRLPECEQALGADGLRSRHHAHLGLAFLGWDRQVEIFNTRTIGNWTSWICFRSRPHIMKNWKSLFADHLSQTFLFFQNSSCQKRWPSKQSCPGPCELCVAIMRSLFWRRKFF